MNTIETIISVISPILNINTSSFKEEVEDIFDYWQEQEGEKVAEEIVMDFMRFFMEEYGVNLDFQSSMAKAREKLKEYYS